MKTTTTKVLKVKMFIRKHAVLSLLVIPATLGGCIYPQHAMEALATPAEYYLMEAKFKLDGHLVVATGAWKCDLEAQYRGSSGLHWVRSENIAVADAGNGEALVVELPFCPSHDCCNSSYIPYVVRVVPISEALGCYEQYRPRLSPNGDGMRLQYVSGSYRTISKSKHEQFVTKQNLGEFNAAVRNRLEQRLGLAPSTDRPRFEALTALELPEKVWKGNKQLASILSDPKWLTNGTRSRFGTIELSGDDRKVTEVLGDIVYEYRIQTIPFLRKNGEWVLSRVLPGFRVYCPATGSTTISKVRYRDYTFELLGSDPVAIFDPKSRTVAIIHSRIFDEQPFL